MQVVENYSIKSSNGAHNYYYKLVHDKIKNDRNNKVVDVYGIIIERHDLKNGRTVNIERDSRLYISPNKAKVQGLLRKLIQYEISPIHFNEYIEDYIEDYMRDFV